MGPEQRAELRRQRLEALVAHARENSPYFRRLYRDVPGSFRLEDLPPTDKKTLMAHWDEWVCAGDLTLAEVELITGKSHQIRAHMAAIGHPLAGDVKYGGHTRKGIRSQLLHAYAVRFPKLEGTFAALSEKEFCCETPWLKEWG